MDYAAAVSEIRETVPSVVAIYLFGSRARGDANRESDVDLALLPDVPLDSRLRFELQERISVRLRCSVDLIDLRSASAVLRLQVLEHGQVLFDADPSARASFEACALAAYARLNEERAGILEDVRRTGRVHG